MEELAKKKGWAMSHVAMSWLLHKGVSSPIIGLSNVERMEEALQARDKALTEEEQKYLEEEYLPKKIMGHG